MMVMTILVISVRISPGRAQFGSQFVVTYALPYDFYEYSQFTSHSYAGDQWLSAISAGLYSRSAANDLNYDLELAYQFPVSSLDGLTHVVVLRDNLRFSDGTVLTADDVVFTYQSLLSPVINQNNYRLYTQHFESNDSIIAVDEITISFTIKEKWSGFMTLLSSPIQPKAHFQERLDNKDYDWNADDYSDAISAGPFMIESYNNSGMEIIMVRNQNYWNADNVVSDMIIFKKIAEKVEVISAMANDEIQIIDSQYVAGIDEFDELNNMVDFLVPSLAHQELSINHHHPFFGTGENLTVDDKVEGAKNVRKAMSHIVDRVFAAEEVMMGLAAPSATIVPPSSFGWNPNLKYREYSITRAKELMELAGFDYGTLGAPDEEGVYNETFFNLTILLPNTGPARNSWVMMLNSELPKIGIGSDILATSWQPISERTFYSDIPPPTHDEGGFDLLQVGYGWGRDFDPFGLFDSFGMRPNGDNFYNYNDSDYDELSKQLHEEMDLYQRFNLMQDIQDYYYEWEIVIPIMNPYDHWAFRDDLVGYNPELFSLAQAEWDRIGTQLAIDAIKPYGSFLDFNLFSLILPFLIIGIVFRKYSIRY
jgi:ABC-type transport system substrate-binding protein